MCRIGGRSEPDNEEESKAAVGQCYSLCSNRLWETATVWETTFNQAFLGVTTEDDYQTALLDICSSLQNVLLEADGWRLPDA